MMEVEQIAQAVARTYHRRLVWTDLDDLLQEARVVMLSALPSWKPGRGPCDTYLRSVATKHLYRATIRWRAPVSCGSDHRVPNLNEVTRTSLVAAATVSVDAGLEEKLGERMWERRVARRLRRRARTVLGTRGRPALLVLKGEDPTAVAAGAGLTVRQLRRAVSKLRAAIADDLCLLRLLREK